MSEPGLLWNQADKVEALCLAVADGDAAGLAALTAALIAAPLPEADLWPRNLQAAWTSGAELVVETFNRSTPTSEQQQFSWQLAVHSIDFPLLRDLLANMARTQFADYLDPAGLLQALGVHAVEVTLPDVLRRWQVFAEIAPGQTVYHPAHGVGKLVEIDEITGEVSLQFDQPLDVPMAALLPALVVILPDSPLDKLRRGKGGEKPTSLRTLMQMAQKSLAPVNALSKELYRALLVPSVYRTNELSALLGQPLPTTLDADDDDAAPEQPVGERTWANARSIEELVDVMQRDASVPRPDAAGIENLTRLWKNAGARRDQGDLFCESCARIFMQDKLRQQAELILTGLADEIIAWQEQAYFAAITDALAGKLMNAWLSLTAHCRGDAWLAAAATELPMRLWAAVEKVFDAEGMKLLTQAAIARIENEDCNADVILWLWRHRRARLEQVLMPATVFRTLHKPVRGNYHKAQKDLRKLLVEGDDFQRTLMQNGDEAGVRRFVGCVRQLPLLDSGEQQSVLVRIVRLFPNSIALVEQRSRRQTKKALPKITSMRSYEMRRRELEEITKVKIPENSRAISVAREHGDLRENAEFKAAKEEQHYLSARRGELERDLDDVQPTDFHQTDKPEHVVPGSTVQLKTAQGETRIYHVLGLWDSLPERQMVGYSTPIGKALLGQQPGDELTLPTGEAVTVVAVETLPMHVQSWIEGKDLEEAVPHKS